MEKTTEVVRNYKDTVFRMLFQDKVHLLELYNAVNQTAYENPEELEIVTLENAVYLGMKNDVAFLIDFHLYLYEHQSTVNSNMPLRFLQYVAREYEKFIQQNLLYRSRRTRIPAPRFCVFYNGKEKQPERWTECLSQAFETKEPEPALELKVEFFNINSGMNETLMKNCKTLSEYMQYVNLVREKAEQMLLQDAVNQAVDFCIRKGILSEFLRQNKAEVTAMSIFEYDEEGVRKMWQEDAREEGLAEGRAEGLQQGIQQGREQGEKQYLIQMVLRKLQKGKSAELIAEELGENPETVAHICTAAEKCATMTDTERVYEYLNNNIG